MNDSEPSIPTYNCRKCEAELTLLVSGKHDFCPNCECLDPGRVL